MSIQTVKHDKKQSPALLALLGIIDEPVEELVCILRAQQLTLRFQCLESTLMLLLAPLQILPRELNKALTVDSPASRDNHNWVTPFHVILCCSLFWFLADWHTADAAFVLSQMFWKPIGPAHLQPVYIAHVSVCTCWAWPILTTEFRKPVA